MHLFLSQKVSNDKAAATPVIATVEAPSTNLQKNVLGDDPVIAVEFDDYENQQPPLKEIVSPILTVGGLEKGPDMQTMLFEAVVALPGVQVAVVYTDVELILLAHLFDVALGCCRKFKTEFEKGAIY